MTIRRVVVVMALSCVACVEPEPQPDGGADATGGGGGGGAVGGGTGGGASAICEPACDEMTVCEERECVSRVLGVRWLSPGNGSQVEAGETVLTAGLTPFPSREPYSPATLSATLSAADGGVTPLTLQPRDGVYSTQVTLARGLWTARVDVGVLNAQQTFRVGPEQPSLVVHVSDIPDAGASSNDFRGEDPKWPRSYRRDAHVTVRVNVEAGVAMEDSLGATLLSDNTRTPLVGVACPATLPCVNTQCACFDAALGVPTFAKFRGTMRIEASARDLDGAPVARMLTNDLRVTRWAWGRRFFVTNATDMAFGPELVLDSKGRAIVAYLQGATAVTTSIDSAGDVVWQTPRWSQTTPIVGQWPDAGEVVHLPNFGEAFVTVSAETGAVVTRASTDFYGINVPATLVPSSALDGGHEFISGLTYPGDPSSSNLFTFGPEGWTVGSSASGTLWSVTANGTDIHWSMTNLFDQASIYSRRIENSVWATERSVATPVPTWRMVATDGGVVASSAYPRDPTWFRWPTNGPSLNWRFDTNATLPARAFVMPNSEELIGARYRTMTQSEFVRLRIGATTPEASVNLPPTNAPPALGADGTVYVATVGGELRALRRDTLATLWQEPFTTEAFEDGPQLDCARTRQGVVVASEPGRLVLVGRSGRAYSVVVDSHGLDTLASWPVELHDPANTNNLQTDLSRFACP